MADDSSAFGDIAPEPDPSGSLVPPPRHPPTAVEAAAPLPPEPPVVPARASEPALLRMIRQAVDAVLDVADDVADNIASAAGIGPRRDAR